MLLHKDNKFIYKNCAFKIPNNVYLDPNPDPCPIEGMVLYSADMRAQVEVNFLRAEKEARAFLIEGAEVFENYECTKPIAPISTNGLEGFAMAYNTSRYSYEEYAFNIGDSSELLNICIEQKRDKPADQTQYGQLINDLLTGIKNI